MNGVNILDGSCVYIGDNSLRITCTPYEPHTPRDIKVLNKVLVNNKNNGFKEFIEYKTPKGVRHNVPDEIIVQGDATVFISGKGKSQSKIVLRKSEEDDFNLEYAFLYAYFLKTTGMSKTAASKLLNSIRNMGEEN